MRKKASNLLNYQTSRQPAMRPLRRQHFQLRERRVGGHRPQDTYGMRLNIEAGCWSSAWAAEAADRKRSSILYYLAFVSITVSCSRELSGEKRTSRFSASDAVGVNVINLTSAGDKLEHNYRRRKVAGPSYCFCAWRTLGQTQRSERVCCLRQVQRVLRIRQIRESARITGEAGDVL